jgi:hypothetical protein
MIVRIEIDTPQGGLFDYRVTYEGESLYADAELPSLVDALVAAVEGLAPDVVGAEVWYRGVVSGTYPLHVIAGNHAQIATHAVNTTAAIMEAMPGFE